MHKFIENIILSPVKLNYFSQPRVHSGHEPFADKQLKTLNLTGLERFSFANQTHIDAQNDLKVNVKLS